MTGNQKIKTTFRIIKNKFILTGLLFFTWLILFDQNSIVDRISLARRNSELQEQKKHYQLEIESNRLKMEELHSDPEHLEKYAREQYLMKKPNEELFIVIEE
ncbi:FtsB family cell division protein [Geofilum sp. OHC36d9]|uniref:FtsB family cell division protein n=1 Tax=Geofilum sp. OHC36d9 TaxID=3458413 RepID=UPI004034E1B4